MAKDGPNWDGLLKWSLSHADGTRPTRQLRYGLHFVVSQVLFRDWIEMLAWWVVVEICVAVN